MLRESARNKPKGSGNVAIKTMTIKVQQLDAHGNVFREFVHYATTEPQLQAKLSRIQRAYNMDRTRVLVNGKRIPLANV